MYIFIFMQHYILYASYVFRTFYRYVLLYTKITYGGGVVLHVPTRHFQNVLGFVFWLRGVADR